MVDVNADIAAYYRERKMACVPVITPERWLADFEKIDIRPEVRPLILKENAVRLLKLDQD